MHLLVKYYRSQDGMKADWKLYGLTEIYAKVSIVNRDFANRLRDTAKKDANINALVNLDCFTTVVLFVADDSRKQLTSYFSAYFT